jgi:hypothetical protein
MTKEAESGAEAVALSDEKLSILTKGGATQGTLVQRAPAEGLSSNVVINVRFAPDGLVCALTYQPEHMTPQAWFDHLCRMAPHSFRALAGGRGSFSLNREEFAAISAAADGAQ